MRWRSTRPGEPSGPAAYELGSATDRGPRRDNQDRSASGEGWVAVSDGMGGYAGGALAAELALDAVRQVLDAVPEAPSSVLLEAIQQANRAVRAGRAADPDVDRMGATLTLAVRSGAGEWVISNLGDSPGWLVRADGTTELTEEHNLAGELVREGALDPAYAAEHPGRRMLLKAVGIEEEVAPATRTVAVTAGDRLVLASDGLGTGVDTSRLHELLPPLDGGSAAADARALVDAAVSGGASDNVTVVVVRIG